MMKTSTTLPSMTAVAISIVGNFHCDNDSFNSNVFSNEKSSSYEMNISPEGNVFTKSESIAFSQDKYKSWNRTLEKRYDVLIAKKYTNIASKEELLEYADLTAARERLLSPMSADEIIAEMNREKVANDLIRALENYKKYVG